MASTPAALSVTVDCNDLEKVAAFWRELLDLEEKGRDPGYVFLGRAGGQGRILFFQRVSECKTVKNRVHLDLGIEDPGSFTARVAALGGTRLQDHEEGDLRWTVMGDREGSEFCVAQKG